MLDKTTQQSSQIQEEKHLSWIEIARAVDERLGQEFVWWSNQGNLSLPTLRENISAYTTFPIGKHKLFILNRFSAEKLTPGMWSTWNCFVLKVYFPPAYTPQAMHKFCTLWFVRHQRLQCEMFLPEFLKLCQWLKRNNILLKRGKHLFCCSNCEHNLDLKMKNKWGGYIHKHTVNA